MKELALYNLKEGMVLAKDITTPSGQVVLEKGKELTKQSILRLSFYNIKSACIVDGEEKQAAPKSYSQKIKTSQKFQSFQVDHTIVLSQIRVSFEGYVNEGKPLDTAALLSKVIELFQSCKTSLELFNMLHNMHSSDDSVYVHSLNVSLICRQIGKWLKADDATLDMLTLAGLLHDIGKLRIPTELLNKPGKYTDEEFAQVKLHTQYGYELLKPLPLDTHVKLAALSHHERCDGTGYPSGLKTNDIDPYARVVAIADVYDAMTTARSYRAPLCAFQVIANFERDGLQKYDTKCVLAFLNRIAGTYQNHRILLSDGRSANIVMLNDKAAFPTDRAAGRRFLYRSVNCGRSAHSGGSLNRQCRVRKHPAKERTCRRYAVCKRFQTLNVPGDSQQRRILWSKIQVILPCHVRHRNAVSFHVWTVPGVCPATRRQWADFLAALAVLPHRQYKTARTETRWHLLLKTGQMPIQTSASRGYVLFGSTVSAARKS